MTTYYVDPTNGSDANNGLGPDASAATNKPWATLTKVLASGSSVVGGDTIYVAPGIVRQGTTLTVGISPTSTVNIIGDPGNAQGFKSSGGVATAPAPVIFTAWTTDTSTPFGSVALVTYAGNPNFAWSNMSFEHGTHALHAFGTATASLNHSFTNCTFYSHVLGAFTATANFGVSLNITFDRCVFMNRSTLFSIVAASGTGSDYDINITVKNSLIFAFTVLALTGSGAGANLGNGFHMLNCTVFSGSTMINTNNTLVSNTVATTIYNSTIICGATVFSAGAANGLITEDYNVIDGNTVYTNTTAGTHSNVNAVPRFHFGQEFPSGRLPRPFGEPMSPSPLIGFGNNGSQTSYDGLNRPRPAGSSTPSAGWLERGNTASQGTTPAPPLGTKTWQGTAAWYQEFTLPVNTTSTTVAVKVQRDASYTGTAPQLQILAQPELGVSAQTITDAGGTGTWNTLTAAAFTPTAIGAVTVRIYSGDTSGVSVVSFANFTVT